MEINALNVSLEIVSSGDRYSVIALQGREALGELWSFSLTLILPEESGPDPEDLLWTKAILRFESPGEYSEPEREIRGRLAKVTVRRPRQVREEASALAEPMEWQLTFVPEVWALTRSSRNESYLNQKLSEIFAAVLERAGFVTSTDFKLGLSDQEAPLEFVLQYEETDWAFLCRVAERAGVTLFFDHAAEAERLTFTDSNGGLPSSNEITLTYADSGGASPRNLVRDVERHLATTLLRYVVDDYSCATPKVALLKTATVHASGLGEVIEYGSHHPTPEAGQKLVAIRAEEQAHQRSRLQATTHRPALRAGGLVTIEDHEPALVEQRVLWVEHELSRGSYRNRFESIDASLTYRPERRTPRPRIGGVLSGIVQADPTKQEAPAIDSKGRYIVQLLCDSVAADEKKVTLPIRKAQPFSGPGGVGMHCPLLPDTEVLVAFENGDPDRPVIIGAVPTELAASPVTDQNADRSVLRSATGVLVQFK